VRGVPIWINRARFGTIVPARIDLQSTLPIGDFEVAITVNVDDDWMASTLWVRDVSPVRNATLTIKLKVWLNRCRPSTLTYEDTSGVQHEVTTIEWDAGSYIRFRNKLKNVVEAGWSQRFWLVPDSDWAGCRNVYPVEGPEQWRPAIGCRLQVEFAGSPGAAHLIIDSHRLPEGADGQPVGFFRSSMSNPASTNIVHRSCTWAFNMARGTLDTGDVVDSNQNVQIAAVHEFGHYMGLSHVNAAGARAQGEGLNSNLAYGVGDQRNDYMGAGIRYATWHAYPWCRRLRRHLSGHHPGGNGWHSTNPIQWQTAPGFDRQPWSRVTWTVTMERSRPLRTHSTFADNLVMPG